MASFLCYAVVNSIGLSGLASLQLSQSQYANELMNYFICESSRISPNKVCERSFEDFLNPLPTTLSLFLIGTLFQLLILLYVINFKEVYRGIKHFLSQRKHMIYSLSAGQSTESSKNDQYALYQN